MKSVGIGKKDIATKAKGGSRLDSRLTGAGGGANQNNGGSPNGGGTPGTPGGGANQNGGAK